MKLKIYVIRDIQANRSLAPMYRDNDKIAQRDFTNMINADPTPQNPFAMNPEDFTLYRIGEWDDETDQITGRDRYRIINGKEALVRQTKLQDQIDELNTQIQLLQNGEDYAIGGTD